jgi:hypothetical protein
MPFAMLAARSSDSSGWASIAMLLLVSYLWRKNLAEKAAETEREARLGLLAPKLEAMEAYEREAERDPAAFRRRCWRKAILAHFGFEWFLWGLIAAIGWCAWAFGYREHPEYWARTAKLHLVLLIPFTLIASGLTRGAAAKLGTEYWDKLLRHFRLGGASWITLGLISAAYPTLVLLDRPYMAGLADPPKDAWPLAPFAAVLFLVFAVELTRIFPLRGGLTDRVLTVDERCCPRLHELVRETARATGLTVPKHIFLAHESSMAHVDVYLGRGDFFRGRVTELRLGLRHILILSPDELRTVIAHELRHQQHGSALRAALIAVLHGLREQGSEKFAAATELELRLCVLMRLHEKESDHASAAIDGPATARALARVHAYAIVFHQFWENLGAFVLRHPKPPGGPRQIELARAAEPDFPKVFRKAYAEAMLYVTMPGSTHPELSDRLKAIGLEPPREIEALTAHSAAELLDAEGQAFLRRQEQEWVSRNREAWDQRWAEEAAKVPLLETPPSAYPSLTAEQLKAICKAFYALRTAAEAMAATEAYHAARPKEEHTELWRLDARHEANIEGADLALLAFARAHPRSRIGIADVAVRWKLQGRDGEAAALWREYLLAGDLLKQDQTERDLLPDSSLVDEHALPAEDLEKLKGVCLDYGVISQAHLCRRRLKHIPYPEEHIIILGFGIGANGRYRADFEQHQTAAIEAIKAAWGGSEGQLWVIKEDLLADLTRRVRALPNARLHG